MDNEQAFAIVERSRASSSSERLRAARFLARNATSSHRNRLSKLRDVEHNAWVRQALDQALKRPGIRNSDAFTVAVQDASETPFLDAHLNKDLRAQAIEETSAFFLHELRPLIGLLEVAAADEIDRYRCSRTKTSVDRVRSSLDAIERLRKASAAPNIKEFDLTDLVIRVAADEVAKGRATLDNWEDHKDEDAELDYQPNDTTQLSVAKLSLVRRDPVLTTGDPTLVELAVTNALRNAIEATLEVPEDNRSDVILNWSVTDSDSWIVVLDEGCGLPAGFDRLTEPGVSTKSKDRNHLGMGLPIAQRAIESMQGSLQLTPRSGSGVSCTIRWPRASGVA